MTYRFGPRRHRRSVGTFKISDLGAWYTHRLCEHCTGRGYCYDRTAPDPEWCCRCGGAGETMELHLPTGATARLGRALLAALEAS